MRFLDQTNIPTCVREKKLCKFHCRAKAACDNKAVSDVTNTWNGEGGNGERGTGNGERGTGNRERESGNECTAVIRIRIQNGGRKHGKRVWEPVLSTRSSNSRRSKQHGQ